MAGVDDSVPQSAVSTEELRHRSIPGPHDARLAAVDDDEHPPVTGSELRGWYAYDAGSSAIATVVVSAYWPLLVQEAGMQAAGFPAICPNIITNATLITQQQFGTVQTAMFRDLTDAAPETCNAAGWCPGEPQTVSECLQGDGRTLFQLRADGFDPTSFASLAISISVVVQVLVFISMGAFADFGRGRLRMLQIVTYLGSLLCLFMLTVTPAAWLVGAFLGIAVNILYGASFISYNAWLPHLAAKDPDVLASKMAADSPDGRAAIQKRMDDISGRGFAWGYIGSVICLLITVGVTLALPAITAFPINIAIAGVWWAGFATWTFCTIKPRPGPPLPAGTEGAAALCFSWRRTCSTLGHARALPNLWTLLLLWFFYSDGFSVISSVGALFANSEIRFGFSKSLALSILIMLSPTSAAIGNFFWEWAARRFQISAKTVIVLNLFLMAIVPAWGILGLVTSTLGFRQGWELFLGIVLYGFNLGSVQSFSRSLFASMTPRHRMAEIFAIYETTDKGSSWLGPLVLSAFAQSVGNVRWIFIYILVMLILPAIGLSFLVNVQQGHRDAIAREEADGFITSSRTDDASVAPKTAAAQGGAAVSPAGTAALTSVSAAQ